MHQPEQEMPMLEKDDTILDNFENHKEEKYILEEQDIKDN